MPKTTEDQPIKVQSGSALRRTFQSFLAARKKADDANKVVDRLKKFTLLPSLEANGEEDEKGSQFVDFDAPVEYDGITWNGLKRERRVTQTFDEAQAEALLRKHGLWLDEKQEKALRNLANAVPALHIELSVNQDEFSEAFYKKLITEEEYDSCYTDVVTYAFVPQKR